MRCATPTILGRSGWSFPGMPKCRRSRARHDRVTIDVERLRREEFPWAAAGESIYLNTASTGPLPRRCVAAVADFAERRSAPHRMTEELQFGTLAKSRELLAQLIKAKSTEIALTTNTGFGINIAATSLALG